MSKIKKSIAILLAVLFLVSLTASAVSAVKGNGTKNTKLLTSNGVKTSKSVSTEDKIDKLDKDNKDKNSDKNIDDGSGSSDDTNGITIMSRPKR